MSTRIRILFAVAILGLSLFPGSPVWAQKGPAAQNERRVERPKVPGRGIGMLERLRRMDPEERKRVLEKFPPERRKRVEDRLEEYSRLPAEEREQLRMRLDRFGRMPRARQEKVRALFRSFTDFPPPRRAALLREFRALREMAPMQRRARMQSEDFRKMFGAREQNFLRNAAALIPSPASGELPEKPLQ